MSGPALRAYEPPDAPAVVGLWDAAVGAAFPLREEVLHQCLEGDPQYRPGDALVAWSGGRAVGFGYVGLVRGDEPQTAAMREPAHLQAVVVAPDARRAGLGRRLAHELLEVARREGRRRVDAGAGLFYLWPGVPVGLEGAEAFAKALGFEPGEVTHDLVGDVSGLDAAPARRTLEERRLEVRPARPTDRAAILDFLFREFGGEWWHDTRWYLDRGGRPDELLLLRDAADEICGLVRIHTPATRPVGPPHFWAGRRATAGGGLGPIGVAARLRGGGIGRALLTVALDELRVRGLADVIIDFTHLLGFYGPLGFRPWITYRHASAPIDRLP